MVGDGDQTIGNFGALRQTMFVSGIGPAAYDCRFNRSMQHAKGFASLRGAANETKTSDLLHRDSKGTDVGAVAQRRNAYEIGIGGCRMLPCAPLAGSASEAAPG
ncbi:hypothetical protein CBM2623_B160033 [Cupriavidus taiwanensis]|nr:hypothetical protein CBM2608_B140034 [Cupriavidus taiwanensis]SPA32572.1 hypothetical protein CBM2623_B160033 [Cupriavidus taiwanensis]